MRRVELAAEAGLALNTIRNYEDGLTKPADLETLRRIADVLEVDFGWLLGIDPVEAA